MKNNEKIASINPGALQMHSHPITRQMFSSIPDYKNKGQTLFQKTYFLISEINKMVIDLKGDKCLENDKAGRRAGKTSFAVGDSFRNEGSGMVALSHSFSTYF